MSVIPAVSYTKHGLSTPPITVYADYNLMYNIANEKAGFWFPSCEKYCLASCPDVNGKKMFKFKPNLIYKFDNADSTGCWIYKGENIDTDCFNTFTKDTTNMRKVLCP
jgi:hypothetical protein